MYHGLYKTTTMQLNKCNHNSFFFFFSTGSIPRQGAGYAEHVHEECLPFWGRKKKKKCAYTHTSELIQQSCHSRSPSSLWKKLIAWRHNSTQYAMHALLTGISNSSTWRHSPPAPLPYIPLLPTDQKHDQAWKSHPHHQRASKKIATAHLHIKLLTTC